MEELIFVVEIADGWPPFEKEVIPCQACKNGYKIMVPPLYVKGISVGDIISVIIGDSGEVSSWKHLEKSGHTTIWLMLIGDYDLQPVLNALLNLGCNVEDFLKHGSCSIDVPPECPIGKVDILLEQLDEESVAIAYPSFRHKDST